MSVKQSEPDICVEFQQIWENSQENRVKTQSDNELMTLYIQ